MAMTLRPTDGLVSRLLQQQTRSQPASTNAASSPSPKADLVTISSQARQQQQEQSYQNKTTENVLQNDLEAQLLRLHSLHSSSGR